MARPFGVDLKAEPLLHFSERQDVLIWRRRPDAGQASEPTASAPG